MRPGDMVDTAIFGRVPLLEVFDDEAEARAAGYYYDGHASGADRKVLARDTDHVHREFCGVRYVVKSFITGRIARNLRETGGVDRDAGERVPAQRGPVQIQGQGLSGVRGINGAGQGIPGQISISDLMAGLEPDAGQGRARG